MNTGDNRYINFCVEQIKNMTEQEQRCIYWFIKGMMKE